jgi:hypothetical protein
MFELECDFGWWAFIDLFVEFKDHFTDFCCKLLFLQKPEFQLSNDDYFSKNNEFATWLKEKKKVFFSDLTSESARELFSVFVKDWNAQKLESRYYEGISSGPRSAHNWALKL